MTRLGALGVLHILDDFLFIVNNQAKCHGDLTNFLSMCEYLGVPMAQEKKLSAQIRLYSL